MAPPALSDEERGGRLSAFAMGGTGRPGGYEATATADSDGSDSEKLLTGGGTGDQGTGRGSRFARASRAAFFSKAAKPRTLGAVFSESFKTAAGTPSAETVRA